MCIRVLASKVGREYLELLVEAEISDEDAYQRNFRQILGLMPGHRGYHLRASCI